MARWVRRCKAGGRVIGRPVSRKIDQQKVAVTDVSPSLAVLTPEPSAVPTVPGFPVHSG
jgi:hypothetical protein